MVSRRAEVGTMVACGWVYKCCCSWVRKGEENEVLVLPLFALSVEGLEAFDRGVPKTQEATESVSVNLMVCS